MLELDVPNPEKTEDYKEQKYHNTLQLLQSAVLGHKPDLLYLDRAECETDPSQA